MPTNDNRFGGRRASLLTTSTLQLGSVLERQSGGYRYRLNWSGAPTVRRRKAASKKGTVYVRKGLLPSAAAASLILAGAATLTALPPGAHAAITTTSADTIHDNTGSGNGVYIEPTTSQTITVNNVTIDSTAGGQPKEAIRIGGTPGAPGTGDLIVNLTGTNSLTALTGDYGALVVQEDGAITISSTGTSTYVGAYGVNGISSAPAGAVSITLDSNDVVDVGTTPGGTPIGTVTGAVGIIGTGVGGGVTINNAAKITGTALAQGIYAADSSTGAVSVGNTSANTIAATNFGIYASSAGGGTTITNSGAISVTGAGAGQAGLFGTDTGGGSVSISTSGSGTINGGDYGIEALGTGTGAVAVNANANVSSSTSGTAIDAEASGAGAVSVNVGQGAAAVLSGGNIINAKAATGGVTVHTYSGSSLVASNPGNGIGILAEDTGATGDAVVTNTVQVGTNVASNGYAIAALVDSGSGNVTVNNSGALYASGGLVVEGINGGTGNVSIDSTGTINGGSTYGIYATTGAGAINIGQNAGVTAAITTSGDGIYTKSAGAGGVNITTTSGGTINAGGAYGVYVNQGGIGTGAVTLNLGGAIGATTHPTTGVYVVDTAGASGPITINANANITSNAGDIIYVDGVGAGTTTINVAANTTLTALGSAYGIIVAGNAGKVTVGAGASITGTPGAVKFFHSGGNEIDVTPTSTFSGYVYAPERTTCSRSQAPAAPSLCRPWRAAAGITSRIPPLET